MVPGAPEHLCKLGFCRREGELEMLGRLAHIAAENEAVVRMRAPSGNGLLIDARAEVEVGQSVQLASWLRHGSGEIKGEMDSIRTGIQRRNLSLKLCTWLWT